MPHARVGVTQQSYERRMKLRIVVVLPHGPRGIRPDFGSRMARSIDDLRIPSLRVRIASDHPVSELAERVLNVARLLPIVQVLFELAVGERATEPCEVPGQERNEHEESYDNKDRPGELAPRRRRLKRVIVFDGLVIYHGLLISCLLRTAL
jgi:hypothetical protein